MVILIPRLRGGGVGTFTHFQTDFGAAGHQVVCITMILMSLYKGCPKLLYFLDEQHTFVSESYFYDSGMILSCFWNHTTMLLE